MNATTVEIETDRIPNEWLPLVQRASALLDATFINADGFDIRQSWSWDGRSSQQPIRCVLSTGRNELGEVASKSNDANDVRSRFTALPSVAHYSMDALSGSDQNVNRSLGNQIREFAFGLLDLNIAELKRNNRKSQELEPVPIGEDS